MTANENIYHTVYCVSTLENIVWQDRQKYREFYGTQMEATLNLEIACKDLHLKRGQTTKLSLVHYS